MALNLDIQTLFLVTMYVEIILGLLLFVAWSQGFSKRALAWWGSAHLLRAISIMLFGWHGTVPPAVSIDLANAVLFASFAVTWSGARVFDRRKPELALSLVGVAIWILACRMSPWSQSPEVLSLIGAGIVAGYTWLTAFEFWRSRAEALVSRWPAIFMLSAHGALFLLRTPLGATLQAAPGSDVALSGWLEILSLEALLFTISIAFILLAMAKERTEYRHRTAARTDPLTGIANRRGFLEQAVMARRAGSDAKAVAVLLFDLDHFKAVNDRFGHAVGDRVLQIFADVAKAHIGPDGMVSRWGGDEFVAVIRGAERDSAAAIAGRIQSAFESAATEVASHSVKATVSAGMVFSANGAFELPALLLHADRALYRAKSDGRNRVAVMQEASDEAAGTTAEHRPSSGRRNAAA